MSIGVLHAASLASECQAAIRFLRRRPLGAFLHEHDLLFGLPLDLLGHAKQVDEHFHLRAEHVGHHRREDVVDRAVSISFRHADFVGKGGYEDDRRMGRALAIAYQGGRFKAVHVGHVDIEQDDGEVVLQDLLERLGARVRKHQLLAQFFQNHLVDQELFSQVVDNQDLGLFSLRHCLNAKSEMTSTKSETNSKH